MIAPAWLVVTSTLIGVLLGGAISTVTQLLVTRMQRDHAREARVHAQKRAAYMDVLGMLYRTEDLAHQLARDPMSQTGPHPQALSGDAFAVRAQTALWGSVDMKRALRRWLDLFRDLVNERDHWRQLASAADTAAVDRVQEAWDKWNATWTALKEQTTVVESVANAELSYHERR